MSRALDEFKDSIRCVQALISMEGRYSDPPNSRSVFAVRGLRGGATVFLVGAFEQYMRSVFEEEFTSLRTRGIGLHQLPLSLREAAIFDGLGAALKGMHPKPGARRSERIPDILRVCGLLAAGHLDPKALGEPGGNPNAAKVTEVFKKVGLADIFGRTRPAFDGKWGRPEAETFTRDKLDEIVNWRHIVAHTADALRISRGQLREWPTFMGIFAEVLDAELGIYVRGLPALRPRATVRGRRP